MRMAPGAKPQKPSPVRRDTSRASSRIGLSRRSSGGRSQVSTEDRDGVAHRTSVRRRPRVGSAARGAGSAARGWVWRPAGGFGGPRVGLAARGLARPPDDGRDPRRRSRHERYGPRPGPDHARCAAWHAYGRDPTLKARADLRIAPAWWTYADWRGATTVDRPGHKPRRQGSGRGSIPAPGCSGPARCGHLLRRRCAFALVYLSIRPPERADTG
jgi:hypothetical protein